MHAGLGGLRYVAGECHLYLGREYRLDVVPGTRAVELAPDRLLVTLPGTPSPAAIETALRAWYVDRARELFAGRLDLLHHGATPFAHIPVRLRVRWMRQRWGSCHPAGRVTLNVELVKTPLSCIDYVIVHELCHLLVPNHSTQFYRLLATCVPDWKERRAEIEGIRIF
jgi:predicted metal-dependent hydrolase